MTKFHDLPSDLPKKAVRRNLLIILLMDVIRSMTAVLLCLSHQVEKRNDGNGCQPPMVVLIL